jgi:hypothetical protein
VLRAISDALNLSAETLLAQAGLIDAATANPAPADASPADSAPLTEDVIRADERLTQEHKAALIAVYRSMLRSAWSENRTLAGQAAAAGGAERCRLVFAGRG